MAMDITIDDALSKPNLAHYPDTFLVAMTMPMYNVKCVLELYVLATYIRSYYDEMRLVTVCTNGNILVLSQWD